jgi:hypothetical protein
MPRRCIQRGWVLSGRPVQAPDLRAAPWLRGVDAVSWPQRRELPPHVGSIREPDPPVPNGIALLLEREPCVDVQFTTPGEADGEVVCVARLLCGALSDVVEADSVLLIEWEACLAILRA